MLNFFESSIPSAALEQEVQFATQGSYGKASVTQEPAVKKPRKVIRSKAERLSMIQSTEEVSSTSYELPTFTKRYLEYKEKERQEIMNSELPTELKSRKLERTQVRPTRGSELDIMERIERSRERRAARQQMETVASI